MTLAGSSTGAYMTAPAHRTKGMQNIFTITKFTTQNSQNKAFLNYLLSCKIAPRDCPRSVAICGSGRLYILQV